MSNIQEAIAPLHEHTAPEYVDDMFDQLYGLRDSLDSYDGVLFTLEIEVFITLSPILWESVQGSEFTNNIST